MSKKSSSQANQTTTSQPITLQDIDGVAIAGNTGSSINITDGGAIKGGLDLAGLTVEKAAELTLGLVAEQSKATRSALDFATKGLDKSTDSENKAYGFAMSAGRSDVAVMQDTIKAVMIVVGIITGGYVLSKWGKA